LILCYFYFGARRGYKLKHIAILIGLFLVANLLSASRLKGYTVFDFVFLYMKLGLINLQLVMDKSYDYTFGFQTFFHFTTYLFPGGLNAIGLEFQEYDWYWNPALYFVSYGYLDFGYFVIFVYFLLGLFCAYLDIGIKRNNS